MLFCNIIFTLAFFTSAFLFLSIVLLLNFPNHDNKPLIEKNALNVRIVNVPIVQESIETSNSLKYSKYLGNVDGVFSTQTALTLSQKRSIKSNELASACINTTFPSQCQLYSYVRYWKQSFFRAQDCYSSPLRVRGYNIKTHPEKFKYVVFHPDFGDWNNMRMAAETVIVFALVTGRVLVLPPENMHIRQLSRGGSNNTFDKLFDLNKISELVDIISMEDFLKNVAGNKLLKYPIPETNLKTLMNQRRRLYGYLERACHSRAWFPRGRFIGFNFSNVYSSVNDFHKHSNFNLGTVKLENIYVNNSAGSRFQLFSANNREVISYNETFHNHRAIYFPGDYREHHRLLTHFYSYLFFADERMDHLYKRMVRDRLRYKDKVFCIAGQIVRMLHLMSAELHSAELPAYFHYLTGGGNTNQGSTYHAFHIRRRDFQMRYNYTAVNSSFIWDFSRNVIDHRRSRVIYIATDEKNISFFDVFKNSKDAQGNYTNFKVVFLHDFIDKVQLPPGQIIDPDSYGMIEQIICANAHTFVGTPISTFTGYITRLRGYYRDHRYDRTFYTLPRFKFQLQRQPELSWPFWAREFAVAHKDIDDDE